MELATKILSPPWLQVHPSNYLKRMLNKSREHIRLLKQGGKLQNIHHKMQYRLGPQSYVNGISLAGFCATGTTEYVKDQINSCPA